MSNFKPHFSIVRAHTGVHIQGDWDTREEAEAYLKKHQFFFDRGVEKLLGAVEIEERGYSDFSDSDLKLHPTRPLSTKGYIVTSSLSNSDNPHDVYYYLEEVDDEGVTCVTQHLASAHVFFDANEALKIMAARMSQCCARAVWEVPIVEDLDGESFMVDGTAPDGTYSSEMVMCDAKLMSVAYPM